MVEEVNLKYRLENIIKEQLDLRKQKNKNYSLRALARDIKVSPSTLSKIINGKYEISDKMLENIIDNLNIHPEKKQKIIFFEQCRILSEFLLITTKSLETFEATHSNYHYQKSVTLDKNIIPEVIYYLKRINEGFYVAIDNLSGEKDSLLRLNNTLDIQNNA